MEKSDRRIKQIQKEDGTYIHAMFSVSNTGKSDQLYQIFEDFWKKVEEIAEQED